VEFPLLNGRRQLDGVAGIVQRSHLLVKNSRIKRRMDSGHVQYFRR
jgi:hypothetical protein